MDNVSPNLRSVAERLDPGAVHPCPYCRRGQLIPIALTDSLGCGQCPSIFSIEDDGFALTSLNNYSTWYWTGEKWLKSDMIGVAFLLFLPTLLPILWAAILASYPVYLRPLRLTVVTILLAELIFSCLRRILLYLSAYLMIFSTIGVMFLCVFVGPFLSIPLVFLNILLVVMMGSLTLMLLLRFSFFYQHGQLLAFILSALFILGVFLAVSSIEVDNIDNVVFHLIVGSLFGLFALKLWDAYCCGTLFRFLFRFIRGIIVTLLVLFFAPIIYFVGLLWAVLSGIVREDGEV